MSQIRPVGDDSPDPIYGSGAPRPPLSSRTIDWHQRHQEAIAASDFFRTHLKEKEPGSSLLVLTAAEVSTLLDFSAVKDVIAVALRVVFQANESSHEFDNFNQSRTHSDLTLLFTERGVKYVHKDPSSFIGWLYKIARNAARTAFRFDLKLLTQERKREPLVVDPPAPSTIEQEELLDAVFMACDRLPAEYREAVLRLVKEERIVDVAKRLKVSNGQITKLCTKGLELVRADLRARGYYISEPKAASEGEGSLISEEDPEAA